MLMVQPYRMLLKIKVWYTYMCVCFMCSVQVRATLVVARQQQRRPFSTTTDTDDRLKLRPRSVFISWCLILQLFIVYNLFLLIVFFFFCHLNNNHNTIHSPASVCIDHLCVFRRHLLPYLFLATLCYSHCRFRMPQQTRHYQTAQYVGAPTRNRVASKSPRAFAAAAAAIAASTYSHTYNSPATKSAAVTQSIPASAAVSVTNARKNLSLVVVFL